MAKRSERHYRLGLLRLLQKVFSAGELVKRIGEHLLCDFDFFSRSIDRDSRYQTLMKVFDATSNPIAGFLDEGGGSGIASTAMGNVAILKTSRLTLKPVELSDAPSLQKHFNDYAVISKLSTAVPWPYPDDGAVGFIQNVVSPVQGNDRWIWGIFRNEVPAELIGVIDLWRKGVSEHRGFWLGKSFWGRGYMTEAASAVTDHAFRDLGFETLVFSNALGNVASRRIKEKTGARFTGVRPAKFVDPALVEAETWELTKSEWEKFKAKS